MHRYCTNSKNVRAVFRKPIGFTKGWDDRKVKKVRNASFWIPKCPSGFRAMGSLAISIKNGKTPTSANFPEFRCVAAQFTQRASYGGLVWTDKGSGGKYDARIYSIRGSPFFMSAKLNKKKISAIYKLRTSIKGKGYWLEWLIQSFYFYLLLQLNKISFRSIKRKFKNWTST